MTHEPISEGVRGLMEKWRERAKSLFGYSEAEAKARAEEMRCCASELEAALAAEGWRPIETAPRDGTSILLWARWGHVMQAEWEESELFSEGGWWKCGRQGAKGYDDTGSMQPTHWMPLPEPPK